MPSNRSIEIEVLVRILCDIRPGSNIDGAYLYAQTTANSDSVIQSGADVWHRGEAACLLVIEATAGKGYDGFKVWKKRLSELSVPESCIKKISLGDREHNTLTEALALVQHARQNAFKAIYIIAPPFHLPRAFMTTVRAASHILPPLQIYSIVGATEPWNESVVHSQGILRARRYELIGEELLRIDRYQHKKNISSFAETKDYLDRRDSGRL
jgi:hypothetical protein